MMDWARLLAYIIGTVKQELLLRNEYLAAENRILKAQIKGRLLLSDAEKKMLADIGHRLGREALKDVANAAKPDTIMGWYRKLIACKFDGSKARRYPGATRWGRSGSCGTPHNQCSLRCGHALHRHLRRQRRPLG